MGMPVLVDEIHVEGGISAFAVSGQGELVAIGSEGMVGLYEVRETPEKTWFRHKASFIAANDETVTVTKLTFCPEKPVLYVKLSDGQFFKLCIQTNANGLLKTLVCSDEELDDLCLR